MLMLEWELEVEVGLVAAVLNCALGLAVAEVGGVADVGGVVAVGILKLKECVFFYSDA
jgi:hypothetical protein